MLGLVIVLVILLIIWGPIALLGTAAAVSGLYEGGLIVKLVSAVGIFALYAPFVGVAYLISNEKQSGSYQRI